MINKLLRVQNYEGIRENEKVDVLVNESVCQPAELSFLVV